MEKNECNFKGMQILKAEKNEIQQNNIKNTSESYDGKNNGISNLTENN